jgi:hypothetical protein
MGSSTGALEPKGMLLVIISQLDMVLLLLPMPLHPNTEHCSLSEHLS